jgi:hypothetical protein
MPIYHIYNTNHLVVCGQQVIVYHKFIINDIEEKYYFIITTLNFLAMMYQIDVNDIVVIVCLLRLRRSTFRELDLSASSGERGREILIWWSLWKRLEL